MKTFTIFLGVGAFAFVAMAYQLGFFEPARFADAEMKEGENQPPRTLPFPEALAPVCQGKGVPQAADFDAASSKPHPLVFLKENGQLHDTWQDYLKPEWSAESVESTELVVVLSPEHKTVLSVQYYPNNAPPVTRYKYELEVHVVVAKTGKVLGRNRFVSIPRRVQKLEAWELTALGQPVSFTTVYNWVAALALSRAGEVQEAKAVPDSNAPGQKP
jgi:hypothetical protein